MKNIQQVTHNHKRAGQVLILESTAELAKVVIPSSGDEFWVKLVDLTPLVAGAVLKSKPVKKARVSSRPNASADSKYRVVRVA